MKGTLTTRMNQVKKMALDYCHRCGGLMVSELSADTRTVEWHCVTCGERIDPVILAHRQKDLARVEAERLFAGKGKARLN